MTEVETEVKLNGDEAVTGAAEATGGTEVTPEPAGKDGEAVIDEGKKDEVEETEGKEVEKPTSTEKKPRGKRGAASPGSLPSPLSDRPHRERKVTERFAVEDIRDKNADVDVKKVRSGDKLSNANRRQLLETGRMTCGSMSVWLVCCSVCFASCAVLRLRARSDC